jgi:flagellar biosynthesis protein FliQ
VTDSAVLDVALQTMLIAAKLSAPILLTALVIGFVISLFQSVTQIQFQSVTQIQEVTLSFVPKMIGVGIAVLVSGNWMLHELLTFTRELFARLPLLLGSG